MAALATKKNMMENINSGTNYLKFFVSIGSSVSEVCVCFCLEVYFLNPLQLNVVAETIASLVEIVFKVCLLLLLSLLL